MALPIRPHMRHLSEQRSRESRKQIDAASWRRRLAEQIQRRAFVARSHRWFKGTAKHSNRQYIRIFGYYPSQKGPRRKFGAIAKKATSSPKGGERALI